jgi:hypothetical protein
MNPAGRLVLPRNLVRAAESEGRHQWLTTVLPAIIAQARERWSLTGGEPFQPGGQTAWVAPVRDSAGADLVLKVAWPHPEAAHEADGLRAALLPMAPAAVLRADGVRTNSGVSVLAKPAGSGRMKQGPLHV